MMKLSDEHQTPTGHTTPSGGILQYARSRFRAFGQNEDGSILPFALALFMAMLLMGGLAVDLMRYEQKRTTLQQTLDRSVLAAASLKQDLDPADVVADYFAKAGMTQYLHGVNVSEGLNFREVNADAAADTKPFFMHMLGINEFDASADSTAEQRISNVEISMVLDISGSMSGSRINALRPAAREFIDTVIASSDPGRVTVSIIPYSGAVNVGAPLLEQFNVTRAHAYSNCIELPGSVYTSASLSRTTSFQQILHFDPYYYSSGLQLPFCTTEAGNVVTPLSDSAATLKSRINAMVVGGNTSIDIGVKWGTLLLDPNANPVIQGLIARNVVKPAYSDRPLNRANSDVIKVLVVMTDGENTTEYQIADSYRSGLSPIYRRNSDGALSIYHSVRSGTKKYWWPYGSNGTNNSASWNSTPLGGTSGSTQLDWDKVWTEASVRWIAYDLYSRALNGGSNQQGYIDQFTDSFYSGKDARLNQICSAAKASGITIFGIGFEAPYSGQQAVQACSTSPGHYYNASGLQITTAFRAIASQISKLRLTQ